MIVSRMEFRLKISEGFTLKDRRRIEKSVSDTLKKKYNVSVIIEREDYPVNIFTIYIAQVNSKLSVLDNVYEKILQYILEMYDVELMKTEFEVLN